jgi:hypothetical protein
MVLQSGAERLNQAWAGEAEDDLTPRDRERALVDRLGRGGPLEALRRTREEGGSVRVDRLPRSG